jgi:hypothetical protein
VDQSEIAQRSTETAEVGAGYLSQGGKVRIDPPQLTGDMVDTVSPAALDVPRKESDFSLLPLAGIAHSVSISQLRKGGPQNDHRLFRPCADTGGVRRANTWCSNYQGEGMPYSPASFGYTDLEWED